MKNENFGSGIRLVGGGYLIYLAIMLLKDVISGEVTQGNMQILSVIAAIAFIVIGAWLVIPNIRMYLKKKNGTDSNAENDITEEVSKKSEVPDNASLDRSDIS